MEYSNLMKKFLLLLVYSSRLIATDFSLPTPALLKRGKIVFEENCLMCHGVKGMGDGPAARAIKPRPRNFVEADFKFGNSPAQMFKTVSNGIPGTAMPPWKDVLPETDRWAVIHYERTFNPVKNNVLPFEEAIKK